MGERCNRYGMTLLLERANGAVCSVPPQWTDVVAPDPDPRTFWSNRLVANTLGAEWNDKLRALAQAREEREHARQRDQLLLDDTIRQRLVTMTTDFKKLWNDPTTPNGSANGCSPTSSRMPR